MGPLTHIEDSPAILGVSGDGGVAASFRFNLLFALVLLSWVASLAGIWFFDGVFVWAAGLLYVVYDATLLLFVAWKTRGLHLSHRKTGDLCARAPVSVGIVIAARNERVMLPRTVRLGLSQMQAGDEIFVVDDGSTDGSLQVLQHEFGLQYDGDCWSSGALRVLRVANGGKAQALNHALNRIRTDVVVTLDADTLLGEGAIAGLREAFAQDVGLVAACGILRPRCGAGSLGSLFEWFQTFEYVRAFLSRAAWMQSNALLLVSGAFAGYRLAALQKVGGFRVDSRVEDYELIHRMHRYSSDHHLGWNIRVVADAYAETDAPANLRSFLAQRKRWFSGFLQTLHANRDMVANKRYGAVGRTMLPVKVVDTMQPVFGITAFALLMCFVMTWHPVAIWVLVVIGAKLVLDVSFHVWSVYVYHRWVQRPVPRSAWWLALAAAFIEPFSFQLIRHAGALLGWTSFLTRRADWVPQRRPLETP